jgi:hypothetical protein
MKRPRTRGWGSGFRRDVLRILRPAARACALLLAFSTLSCEESLPPRETMPVVLKGDVNIFTLAGIIYVREGSPLGNNGATEYLATNVYDEVLDDSATVDIDLDISLKSDPSVWGTARMTAGAITTPGIIRSGHLTLRPGVTMRFFQAWPHRASDGSAFWEHVPLFPGATNAGEPYCESGPVTLVVKGTARFLLSIAPIPVDEEIVVIYRVFGISCIPPPESR